MSAEICTTLIARFTAVEVPTRESNCHQRHEHRPGIRAAEEVGIEEADNITHEHAGGSHHHAGIDPIIEM
jgi:hypothetical protein